MTLLPWRVCSYFNNDGAPCTSCLSLHKLFSLPAKPSVAFTFSTLTQLTLLLKEALSPTSSHFRASLLCSIVPGHTFLKTSHLQK